jgi:hypothetical protein
LVAEAAKVLKGMQRVAAMNEKTQGFCRLNS